jgi:endonuclease/exonuclease/phosphatase family metal-dependent hydrolase
MGRLRVLQFNMQYGMPWDAARPDQAPVDLDGTMAEIRRHDADIIFLQEVEQAGLDGAQPHPPDNYNLLRAAFPDYDGMFAYPRPDERELPFGIGLAILSRTPLRGAFREDLPSPPIEFEFKGERRTPTDRVLLGARTVIEGVELTLLNTHLLAFFMLNAGSEAYPEQRDRIAVHLRQANGPTLLAGDFNVQNHESLVKQFAEVGFAPVQDQAVTWHRRPYVLDHIFYNPPLRCVAHRVEPSVASDHLPLVADFEV